MELRHVRSSQEVSDQIDLELQRQTNKRFRLADLTDPSGHIARVVIMDGLDELLQLSPHEGLGRYLEKLVEFQEVEATFGRPVIAIATARTIVMDRVYVPNRVTVIKLEGFTPNQITSWIAIWNRQNAGHFRKHRLEALSIETMNRYAELARQPLLLALLALYDAESNALRNAGELSQAQLYERLFKRYLEREVGKEELPVRPREQLRLVEQRLRELSTIAIGMLNRGRRFITRQELEGDYAAVRMTRDSTRDSHRIVAVDDAVGQFFFLYRAMAQHRGTTLYEGYEFIHSTFGEFLAARMIAHQLAQAARILQDAPVWDRLDAERHARSLLIPYLVRRPLASEEQVLRFLGEIVGEIVTNRTRAALAIAGLIPALIQSGADGIFGTTLEGHDRLERLAVFSVNLVLVSLRTAAAPMRLGAFCAAEQDPAEQWRRMTVFWKAYLAIDDWDRVLNSLALDGDPPADLATMNPSDRDPIFNLALMPGADAAELRRFVADARLTGDLELAAAAVVWHQVRQGLHGNPSRADLGWLTAAAAIRVGAVGTRSSDQLGKIAETVVTDLVAALPWTGRMLETIDGGPGTWSNDFLVFVAMLVRKAARAAYGSGTAHQAGIRDRRSGYARRNTSAGGTFPGRTAKDNKICGCIRHHQSHSTPPASRDRSPMHRSYRPQSRDDRSTDHRGHYLDLRWSRVQRRRSEKIRPRP